MAPSLWIPQPPYFFYIRTNTLGVNIRPASKKSWYSFHKGENITKLISFQFA